MNWSFDSEDLNRLGRDAFMLRGHIDQIPLQKIELYSRFVEAIKRLKAPDTPQGKAATATSNKAAEQWKSMEALSCNENPRTSALMFDFGEWDSLYTPG
jgi:hypothetical protein